MSIFSRIKGAFGSLIKSPFSYYPLNWRIPPSKKETDWLKVFSENVWVYSAVTRIAQSISMVPWKIVTTDSEGNEVEMTDSEKCPQLQLLKRPNPFMTWQEFSELHQIFMELTGESYWVISYNGLKEPAELWPVPPDRMWVIPDKDKFISGYVYIFGGENIPFEPNEVLHFTYPNPLNIYKGVGPAQASGYVIDIDTFGNEFSKNFFYNGAVPGGVIEAPQSLTTEEYNRVKEQWELSHSGVDKAHRIGILEGGATYKPIELNLQNIQLIENRKQNREDILAGFGVPNSVLGISDNVNKANAEVGETTFAKRTIKPRLIKIAEKINNELFILFKNQSNLKLKLVFEEVTPQDQELILKKVETGITKGIMTINEARELMNLDPIENGDVLVISSTSTLVDIKDIKALSESSALMLTSPIPEPTPSDDIDDEGKELKKNFNSINKSEISSRFRVNQEKHEKAWIKGLKPIWEEMKEEALKNIQDGKKSNIFDLEEYQKKFYEKGKDLNNMTFNDFAKTAYSDIKPNKSFEFKKAYDENLQRIADFIHNKSFKFAQTLTYDTEEMLRAELEEAYSEGEDIDQIMRRIADVFNISSIGYRAERIARTESVSAANAGALEGYEQTGLVNKKVWISAIDERTREAHLNANGQVVGIKSTFNVGGEDLFFPGDFSGSPENIINCRCCVAPSFDE